MMKEKKSLVLQLNVEKHKNKTLLQEKTGLQNKYNQLKENNSQMQKSFLEVEENAKVEEKICIAKTFSDIVLDNIEENRGKCSNLYRYTDEVYEFSKLLSNINAKCYEMLREVIILPSINQIDRHFNNFENNLKENIQNIDKVANVVNEYKSIYNIQDTIDCIISIDAASLDRPNYKGHAYIFAFYVQPLLPAYKCFPVYLHSNKNGNVNEEIKNNILKVVAILNGLRINVRAVATDGDPGYNRFAEETFEHFITIFEREGYDAAVEFISQSDIIFWISDFLHLIKIARKRIIKGPMTIRTTLTDFFTNESLEEILNLGIPLTDKSSIGYMKDFYPLKLFSLENCLKLKYEDLNDEFNYFFPFSIWIESIMSENLTKNTRLYFLKIAFHIFYSYYCQLKNSKFEDGITLNKTQNTLVRWFNKENFIIRSMNTIILTYSLLMNYDEICLNRIGSHPIENFFGHIRIMSKNFDSFENFILSTIRSQENMMICNKYNINNSIKKRINIAGVKMCPNSGWFDINEEICNVQNIAVCAFQLSQIDIKYAFQIEDDQDSFNSFVDILFGYLEHCEGFTNKIYRPKMSTGCAIISRCRGVELEIKDLMKNNDYNYAKTELVLNHIHEEQRKKWQKEEIKEQLLQIKAKYSRKNSKPNSFQLEFVKQIQQNNQNLAMNFPNQQQMAPFNQNKYLSTNSFQNFPSHCLYQHQAYQPYCTYISNKSYQHQFYNSNQYWNPNAFCFGDTRKPH